MNKTSQQLFVLNKEYKAVPLYNEEMSALLGYQIKDETDLDVFFLPTEKWLTKPNLEAAIYDYVKKTHAALHSDKVPGGMLTLFKDISNRLSPFTHSVPFEDYNRMAAFISHGFGISVEEAQTAISSVMKEVGLGSGPSSPEEEWIGQRHTAPFGMQDPGFLAQPLSWKEVKLTKVADLKIEDCLACKLNEQGVAYAISELRNSRRDEREWRRISLRDQLSEMIYFYDPAFTPVSKETYEHLLENHVAELSDDLPSIEALNSSNLNKISRTFNEGDQVELTYEDTRDLLTKGHVLKVNNDATYDVMSGNGEVYQNVKPSRLHVPVAEGRGEAYYGRIGDPLGPLDSPRNLGTTNVINDNPSEYADAKGQEGQTISDVPNPSLNE